MINKIRDWWITFERAMIDSNFTESRFETAARLALVAAATGAGSGYAFDHDRFTTGAFEFVRLLHVPFQVWGCLYLLAAVLIFLPFKIRLGGYYLGGSLCMLFGLSFFLSALHGGTAWSAPSYQGALAVIHIAAAMEYIDGQVKVQVHGELASGQLGRDSSLAIGPDDPGRVRTLARQVQDKAAARRTRRRDKAERSE